MILNFIIPHLNENYDRFTNTIQVVINISTKLNKKLKIIVGDGGSDEICFNRILKYIEELKRQCVNIDFIFPFPITRQNKNNIIKCSSDKIKSGIVFILDSDIPNMSEEFVLELYYNYINNSCKLFIPFSDFQPGRSNKLIGTPILRVLFPDLYKIISHPFPGIIVIDSELLSTVTKKDYFIDWGGEFSNIIYSFIENEKMIFSCPLDIIEEKHRSLHNKLFDSYQIYRTGIYSYLTFDKSLILLESTTIDNHKNKHNTIYRELQRKFEYDRINLLKLEEKIKNNTLQEVYDSLLFYFKSTNDVTYYVIASMVIPPLSMILNNAKIKEEIIPLDTSCFMNLELQNVSLLADFILIASLKHSLCGNDELTRNKIKFSIFPEYTDISKDLDIFNNTLTGGINIFHIGNNQVNKVRESFQLLQTLSSYEVSTQIKNILQPENE